MSEHAQATVVDLHPRTKGKRILYIANRGDGVLQAELEKALQPSRFKFCVAAGDSPNRTRSMAAAIAAGSFDVVLHVEGFLSHGVYDSLVSACKASPFPTVFVPVGRGRVAEVLRAVSSMTMPPPRPPRGGRSGSKMARWSGPELARLEDLALEGKSDVEIGLALKNEFDMDRTVVSISQQRLDCFGITQGGKRTKEGTRKLPQSYHDLRQAQRIREEMHAKVEAAVAPVIAEAAPEPVAAVAAPAPAPARKVVPVSITGTKGIVLLESTRSLDEIIKFLIGDV